MIKVLTSPIVLLTLAIMPFFLRTFLLTLGQTKDISSGSNLCKQLKALLKEMIMKCLPSLMLCHDWQLWWILHIWLIKLTSYQRKIIFVVFTIKTNFTNTRGNSSEHFSYPSIVGFSFSIIFLILALFNSIIDVKINMLLTYEFLCLYEGGHSKDLSEKCQELDFNLTYLLSVLLHLVHFQPLKFFCQIKWHFMTG